MYLLSENTLRDVSPKNSYWQYMVSPSYDDKTSYFRHYNDKTSVTTYKVPGEEPLWHSVIPLGRGQEAGWVFGLGLGQLFGFICPWSRCSLYINPY